MTDTHTTAHIPDEDDTMRDKIIYVCEGCGTATHDPEGYAKKLKAIGALSCCPEHKYIECRAIPTAIPHLSAPCAVEVKKLQWDQDWAYGLDLWKSQGYEISRSHGEIYFLKGNGISPQNFNTLQCAKGAAQADFERRILSCVVTKPVDVAAVRNQAFEEAKRIAFDVSENGQYMGNGDCSGHSIYQQGATEVYDALCDFAPEALSPAEPAQSKPVDVSAGLEQAAQFLDQRLADYVREHGMTDPSTGTIEFPGWGDEYVSELEELAAAIRALSPAEPAQGEQWQPIETAPKDGSFVDLFDKEGCRRADCRWFTNSSQFTAWHQQKGGRAFNIGTDDSFTHWMRSPAAPTTEAGK